jgi:hypothetical protein
MASNHIISSPGADTETIKKGILLAVVKRIEKKWKLD